MLNKVKQYGKKAKAVYYSSIAGALMLATEVAVAANAPDASNVNDSSVGVAKFIIDLLNGATGYMLTLVAFMGGVFLFIQKRDFWGALGCFALAIAILVVPSTLQGFFNVTIS